MYSFERDAILKEVAEKIRKHRGKLTGERMSVMVRASIIRKTTIRNGSDIKRIISEICSELGTRGASVTNSHRAGLVESKSLADRIAP